MVCTVKTSKTSKQNIHQLQTILHHMTRARDYIADDKTVVCKKSSGTTVLDYLNKKTGDFIYPVNKEYGSDLCGIDCAITQLARFIELASH